MPTIRTETPADVDAVRAVNVAAFETPAEAGIVDRLRETCPDHLSLVAEVEGSIVGHILFTPAVIEDRTTPLGGMGLAPMAVQPGHQNRGVGGQLVRAGLEILRGRACPFVIVLGHPPYYPRFGFAPASRDGVRCQWEGVPDEAFMILWLDPSARGSARGVGRYRPEFDGAM
jgi:putative acetyltransferase